ncbi:MAG: isoprenylcysteine carboxylmethyltransferase family protein [Alphaproteobacteria bacterium]
MARHLNKNRIGQSRLIGVAAVILLVVTHPYFEKGSATHDAFELIGYVLVLAAAFGRIFCFAYIGGRKNRELVSGGPFSVVRNPLYLFSLIGALGVGFLSARITFIIVLPALFISMYHYLVTREEGFLREKFGEAYNDYYARTPRFIPNLRLWKNPPVLTLEPYLLLRAMLDAASWFAALPFFELLDRLHASGTLPAYFTLP